MSKSHGNRRTDLAGEHRFGDAGQAVCAVAFGVVWAVDSFLLEWTTFLNDRVPDVVQVSVGAVVLVVAGLVAFFGLRTVFGEVRNPAVVIRSGLFAYVRHPIYLSEVLLYAGLLMLSISLAAAVAWVGAIAFLRALCRYEERLLVARFGDEYRDYMHDVPMWLPRVRIRRDG